MSRYRTYGPRDDHPVQDGDLGFIGVDMRRPPTVLEPGLCSNAVNKDFSFGVAQTRRGLQTVGFANELATRFPWRFRPDHPFLDLFRESPNCFANLNFRVYNGRTLQILCAAPVRYHAIYVTMQGGFADLAIDQNGMIASQWLYSAYNLAEANFRFAGKTLQIRCIETQLWHSVWIQTLGGAPVLTVDQVGMATGDPYVDSPNYNYLVRNGTTLQLLCVDANRWHSLFVLYNGGNVDLAYDLVGQTEEGFRWDIKRGFGTVQGANVFSDPYGNEAALIARSMGTYRVADGRVPEMIYLPPNEELTARCRMVQCFDRVIMFRGFEQEPLFWNPPNDFSLGLRPWDYISQSDARYNDPDNTYGDGTVQIPNAEDATQFNSRLYVIKNRDEIAVSDILDFTRYSEVTNQFRINPGSDDFLTRIFPWNQTTLIAFKDQSIHQLNNVHGDLSELVNDVITMEYGCIARDSVVNVGPDVLFLSEGGVFSFGQALENKLQARADPVSGAIEPLMKRINWAYAKNAVAAYEDNKMFLAVPLDGAKYNNAILVYHFLNTAWMGYWQSPYMDVRSFVKTNYGGRRRLFAVNGDSLEESHAHGAMMLMNAGYEDFLFNERSWVQDLLRTRGYVCETQDDKKFQKAVVDIATWNPSFTILQNTDGVGELLALSRVNETKSRARWYIWGKAAPDLTNANDDHGAAGREDYSVFLAPDDAIKTMTRGFNPQLHQAHPHPYRLDRRGMYVQIEIRNTRGRCHVRGVQVDALAGARGYRPRV